MCIELKICGKFKTTCLQFRPRESSTQFDKRQRILAPIFLKADQPFVSENALTFALSSQTSCTSVNDKDISERLSVDFGLPPCPWWFCPYACQIRQSWGCELFDGRLPWQSSDVWFFPWRARDDILVTAQHKIFVKFQPVNRRLNWAKKKREVRRRARKN